MNRRKTLEILAGAGIVAAIYLNTGINKPIEYLDEWSYRTKDSKSFAAENPRLVKEMGFALEKAAEKYSGEDGQKMQYPSPENYSARTALDIMSTNLKSRIAAEKHFRSKVLGYQLLNKRTEKTIIAQAKKDVEEIIKNDKTLLEMYAKRNGLIGEDQSCVIHSIIALCALTGRATEDIRAGKIKSYEIDLISGVEYPLENKNLRAGHQWIVAEDTVIDRFEPPFKKERILVPLVGSRIKLTRFNENTIRLESTPRIYMLPRDAMPEIKLNANQQ